MINKKILNLFPILILCILGTIGIFFLGALEKPGADLSINNKIANWGLSISLLLGIIWIVLSIFSKFSKK